MKSFDLSAISLILTNVIIIFIAINNQWSFTETALIYWAQSVIIGLFTFIKLLILKDYSTKGLPINFNVTKTYLAFFFLVHYGLFHYIYYLFLTSPFIQLFNTYFIQGLRSTESLMPIVLGVRDVSFLWYPSIIFFINHLFSFFYNLKDKEFKGRNILDVMFRPYIRIIPIHLTIILGAIFSSELLIFLLIKSVVDLVAHYYKHDPNDFAKLFKQTRVK